MAGLHPIRDLQVFGLGINRTRKTAATPEVKAEGAVATGSTELPPPPTVRSGEAKQPKKRFSFTAQGPLMFGLKVGASLAATAVVLGTMLGTPEGRTPVHPTTTIEAPAEPSPELRQGVKIVHDAMRLIAPESLTRESAMSNLGHISLSVRTGREAILAHEDGSGLNIPGGTRISVGLSRHSLSISTDPGVTWGVDWRPDPTIENLTFNFNTGSFSARASGLGPDEWYQDAVVELANRDLRRLLPEAMRAPGYNPYADPRLEQNLEQLIANFTRTTDPETRAPRPPDYSRLTAPEVTFDFRIPSERQVDLGDGTNAWIAAGTRVSVRLSTEGSLTAAELGHLQIHFDKPVEIGRGADRPGLLSRMELNTIHLMPNGQLRLDYDLGAEDAVDGVRALVLLTLLAAEPRANVRDVNLERTRMASIRAEVERVVDQNLEPRLLDQLRIHDQAIGGLSLLRFFGVR